MSRKRRIVVVSLVIGVIAIAATPLIRSGWRDFLRSDLATQCRAASERRRWDDLRSLADHWTEWDSQNAEPWLFRAKAASGQRDWPTATESFWRVPDTDARVVPAMIEVSKIAFSQLNDPLKGRDACERILRVDPRAAGAHQQLIWFYAMTLQREPLLKQVQAAIAVQQEPREAYVYYFLVDSFRSSSAVKLNEHWLETFPNEELFQVARVLHLQDSDADSPGSSVADSDGDQPASATGSSKSKWIDDLLRRFPHNVELLAYKAQERIAAGDTDGAATLLSQVPDSATQDSRFWHVKGRLQESNNELDEAAATYRHALKLHALDWNTMNRLAIVERRRQNIDEVQRLTKCVERATELRRQLRQLPAVELVTPAILLELATLARECDDQEIRPALERRLASSRAR
jgi:tetratricopeptide (TPR) repeat protein